MDQNEIRRIVDAAKAKGYLKAAPVIKHKTYAPRATKPFRRTWTPDKMTVLMQEARRPIT